MTWLRIYNWPILFSPRSKHDVEMRPGRGQPERRERMDRDKLKDLLFEQFEKHQVTYEPHCKVQRVSKIIKLPTHLARACISMGNFIFLRRVWLYQRISPNNFIQYYSLKDLQDITKQPVQFLKEVLKEIAVYNSKQSSKNMWELKPEYRYYDGEKKAEEWTAQSHFSVPRCKLTASLP